MSASMLARFRKSRADSNEMFGLISSIDMFRSMFSSRCGRSVRIFVKASSTFAALRSGDRPVRQVSDDSEQIVEWTRRLCGGLLEAVVRVCRDGERPPIRRALDELAFEIDDVVVAGRVGELAEVTPHETERPQLRKLVQFLEERSL